MSFTRLLVAAAATLSLTACGSEPPPTTSDQEPLVIQVTFDGNDVTPNGDRMEVAVGQPITLEVTADRAGGNPRAQRSRAGTGVRGRQLDDHHGADLQARRR